MAGRRKKSESTVISDNRIDDLFDGLCEEARKHFGADNIFTGSEAEQLLVGLPLPALCLRYLFQSTVLPLSRMGQIVGEEGCCKSSLLYEIFRWVRMFGGRNVLMEAESKDSPMLRASILNYDEKAVILKPCDCLEDWQEGLTHFIKWAKHQLEGTKSAPGPGRIVPMGFGIDSLMGKACRDTIEKITKEGCAHRAFPAEALLISQYMKFVPQQIANWPFIIWGINHLKPGQDSAGRPKNNISGGKSLKFQETYEIEMHRVKDIKKVDIQGITLKLVMRKNSLGPSRLSINVDMLWWFDEDHEYTQRTVFDWNAASIELLLSFEGSRFNKLMEVCDIHVVDKSKKLIWSEALGVPRSSPVTFSEAGELLEDNPEILRRLYPLLHIREMQEFQPGVEYRKQLEEAKQKALEAGNDNSILPAKAPRRSQETTDGNEEE